MKQIPIRKVFLLLFPASIIAGIYFFVYPHFKFIFPACPLHQFTGLYCPGCGSQRAISALLHGHFLIALHYNAFIFLGIPLVFYWAYQFVLGKKAGLFYNKIFSITLLISVVTYMILRNIPLTILDVLRPH